MGSIHQERAIITLNRTQLLEEERSLVLAMRDGLATAFEVDRLAKVRAALAEYQEQEKVTRERFSSEQLDSMTETERRNSPGVRKIGVKRLPPEDQSEPSEA